MDNLEAVFLLHEQTTLDCFGPSPAAYPEPQASDRPAGEVRRPSSLRRFSGSQPGRDSLETLFCLAYARAGVRSTTPSAGNIQGVRCIVIQADGICLAPISRGKKTLKEFQRIDASLVARMTFFQLEGSYSLIVFYADPRHYINRYGIRGYRYMLLEAGHVCHEFGSQATTIGLRSCPIGGFADSDVYHAIAHHDQPILPLYILALGIE